jgi:RNA polymerase sigma-70 factor (ECF subfamily)
MSARFALLYETARQRTGRDESFALDCVQDAMLRIARALPRCESSAVLDAWLRRTVLNAALDRLRSETSRRRREDISADERGAAARAKADDERLVELERELTELGPEERMLLMLRFRGLTLAQLADHFGLAPKAIDSRIRRALARLRERLTGTKSQEELP